MSYSQTEERYAEQLSSPALLWLQEELGSSCCISAFPAGFHLGLFWSLSEHWLPPSLVSTHDCSEGRWRHMPCMQCGACRQGPLTRRVILLFQKQCFTHSHLSYHWIQHFYVAPLFLPLLPEAEPRPLRLWRLIIVVQTEETCLEAKAAVRDAGWDLLGHSNLQMPGDFQS